MGDLAKDLLSLAPANRRSFVKNISLASAAAAVVATSKTAEAQSSGPSDIDILNFALNLEYLEAEFYTAATAGTYIENFGVSFQGSGTIGATVGGNKVNFGNTYVQRVAEELAADERFHVSLLQNTITLLGGTPVGKPAINLNALGLGYAGLTDFLQLARVFEEIGVTAYGGAAPLITSKSVLGYAARILATEAEHVGFIRALISQFNIATSALDGVDVAGFPSSGQFFSLNSSAITGVRTPGQVLYLAYGAANATGGGFFPNGVNGALAGLKTSAAAPAGTDTGVTFSVSPNPVTGTNGLGTVTVTWNAPAASYIEVRIGSPSGPLFTVNTNSGSMMTGPWVTDGTLFYLQDVSYPKGNALVAANTLAVAIAYVN